MYQALPDADYYGSSASLSIIGVTFPWHLDKPSPSPHVGLKRIGEVADRNL